MIGTVAFQCCCKKCVKCNAVIESLNNANVLWEIHLMSKFYNNLHTLRQQNFVNRSILATVDIQEFTVVSSIVIQIR